MYLKRKFTVLLLWIIGIGVFLTAIQHYPKGLSSKHNDSIFLGMIIKNNDQFIPSFLKSIDQLDYNKKLMTVQVNHCNISPESIKIMEQWVSDNQDVYKSIRLVDNKFCARLTRHTPEQSNLLSGIKNEYLSQTQQNNCGHCLIVESDILIAPHTLKELLSKDKPVITPLLRPIPEANDPFRNFFADATEHGYFKDHVDYWPIANGSKKGTFKVPCIQSAYLIQSTFADRLSFSDSGTDWEFIAFSKNASRNNVEQYICNEREFGSLLHFPAELSEDKEREFALAKRDTEIIPATLNTLFAPYFAEDSLLQRHIANFDYDKYALYRVENRDLYYVDENYDLIKSLYIKKCAPWEENIHAELKKYTKPGTVALDIGGHIGTHTINLSRLVGDYGTVHVFEPRVKMFTELLINMHINGCKNVQFHRRALGNEEKQITMSISSQQNEGMARISDFTPYFENEAAKMQKLDDLNLHNVSMIKMDVSGYEMEIIKGGLQTILRDKPAMIIEIYQGPENLNHIRIIEALGYAHFHLSGDDYLFLPDNRT